MSDADSDSSEQTDAYSTNREFIESSVHLKSYGWGGKI